MYAPKVDDLFKLKRLELYAKLSVNGWAWFRTVEVNQEQGWVRAYHVDPPSATHGPLYEFPLNYVKLPHGWYPVYNIEVTLDEQRRIEDWLQYGGGVAVWTSLDPGRSQVLYTRANAQRPSYHVGLTEDNVPAERIRFKEVSNV